MGPSDYLVACGLAGEIAPYRAAGPFALARGDRVVVRGVRGLELGEVVRPASEKHAAHFPATGELVRLADDDDLAAADAMARRASTLLARAAEVATELGLPVEPLDAEVLLGGEAATLLYLRWSECDIRELVRPLSSELGLMLTLTDLTAPASHGGCGSCGDGGCGSGGCGSGGCGSGCASPSQDELREYFAGLREKFNQRMSLL